MIHDRGSIKWSSLMLPEHVEMLRELWREDADQTMPIIDEQKLDEMNELIHDAYNEKHSVKITFFSNQRIHSVCGYISTINPIKASLTVMSDKESLKTISFTSLIDVQIA
ncbi:YolD-like family protein [Radiobacillus kanasensis]|uniref:YolD-like family protein n=1 Tax=Radiobacillus kanasensis TaxID=2844358 RepID=UPI001E51A89F|nr:YolD-like family protein [Radiobacillus kanasensis]UFU01245.1 YolD-like family protein [Radiobacillus kanasensis]